MTRDSIVSDNMTLVLNCDFKGYLVFVRFGNYIFCEIVVSTRLGMNYQVYYDFSHLQCWSRKNTIRMILEEYSKQEPSEHLALKYTLEEIRSLCELYYTFDETVDPIAVLNNSKQVVNIKQVKKTGELIYILDNVVYSEHFPLELALDPHKDGVNIAGPGTSKSHCLNCNTAGSLRGVFIGYCGNCAYYYYKMSRGRGFNGNGQECPNLHPNAEHDSSMAPYLFGVDLQNIGYVDTDTCLSGGWVPTGPDICDDQSDLDPVRESENDSDIFNANDSHMRESKRHPRRAYGIPNHCTSSKFIEAQITDNMTPDFIRNKIEQFFAANDIEVIDNNYSFPIGPRESWDHYRVEKRPNYWYAWNAIFKSEPIVGGEDVNIRVCLYLSNPKTDTSDTRTMLLTCNNVKGRSNAYYSMKTTLGDWILGNTDSTDIFVPDNHCDVNQELQQAKEEMENGQNRDDGGLWVIITYYMILYIAIRLLL